MSLRVQLADATATEALGAALAEAARQRAGGVIHLEGDLGAGKTTLARGFLRACGVSGTVRSPTYTLMEPYEAGGRRLLHMDLYRLVDPAELWELGLDGYPPEQVLWLVEWPERAAGLLPPSDLRLRLHQEGSGRLAEIEGDAELLAQLRATMKATR